MHNDVRAEFAYSVLARVLEFFDAEISQSSDEEVLGAAADLRMNPRMKGSIAFAGIRFPAHWSEADFHGLSAESLAALQRRFDLSEGAEHECAEGWPDYANLAVWVALIRQLRGK